MTAASTLRTIGGGAGGPALSSLGHEAMSPLGEELARVLATGGLRTDFQPVVDLDTRTPVAFEALVRGPAGSPLQTPHDLFSAAAASGRLDDLDVACRQAAVDEAAAAGLTAPWTLFLNHQPEAALVHHTAGTTAAGKAGPDVVVDLPGHALAAHPAAVVRLVEQLRRRGCGIALDDVGADPAVLPLLALVRPDVVKIDLRLLGLQPEWAVAAVVTAVGAQAERDGGVVLVEAVETEEQYRLALTLGASLAQGWLFGRPGALGPQLAAAAVPPSRVPVLARPSLLGPETPFELAARRGRVRLAERRQLAAVARQVELLATHSSQPHLLVPAAPALLLGATSGAAGPTAATAAQQRTDLAVLGPDTAAAVVSRSLGDEQVELVVTYDRDLVAALVARLLEGTRPGTPPTPDAAAGSVPRTEDEDSRSARVDLVELASRRGLDVIVAQAVDADRRRGSGCALLLLGTDHGSALDNTALDSTAPDSPAPDGPAPRTTVGSGPGGADALRHRDPSALVVRRLRSSIRSADRWIPLGERLHAVLLIDLPVSVAEGVVDRVADSLLHAVESSTLTAPEQSGVRVSIGASLAPFRAATSADAITQAAAALAAARSAGGHCARIWPV